MSMSIEEQDILEEAIMRVKSRQKDIVQKFAEPHPSAKPVNGAVSIRTLGGDSPGKRQLYEQALEGAALDQKKIVDVYNKKFEFQGKIFTK